MRVTNILERQRAKWTMLPGNLWKDGLQKWYPGGQEHHQIELDGYSKNVGWTLKNQGRDWCKSTALDKLETIRGGLCPGVE